MAFGKMSLENSEADYAFEKSFGVAGIHSEELYYDPIRGIDKRAEIGKKMMEVIQKAPSMSSTSGSTYTGYSMLPPFVDPSIVDKTVRETPLVRLLPRRAVRGRSYVYNIISAKAGASFLPEDAALSEQVDTRSTGTASMKFLYAVGRVTGIATASETIINMMAEDIRVKTASMNEALENTIINGNATTYPNEFNGFVNAISTNTTNNSGSNITLAQMRTDINTSFEANGLIDLIVTDGYTLNYIKGLLMDYQRHIAPVPENMSFGIPDAFLFDGIMVIKDRYMPTTATSRRILYLDTRYIFLAVLQDYTYEELAKTNDSQKYMLKWYGTLVLTFESSSVMRYGLA
ncbi:MAG: SU10 major capsid protein [Bacillota bacterium]